ncbi:MAG: sugar phosphate isomerase/epimerase [Lentisphaeria bacterium]|nr:sugar phosphate isomerase/epimerase [Lentisphaeria bacterium]NQZ69594.1 sugar phosphate isomerase/epimerase [Lentisphaeria bacterium]
MADSKEDIRIGTIVNGGEGKDPANYIGQILKHGFESFQLSFWQKTGKIDWQEQAEKITASLGDSGAVINALGCFGNPLDTEEIDKETLKAWEDCIDNAHLFGASIVAGFTGRLRGKSIPDSIPRFKEVFGELTKRAEDKGVKIAFENCDMGGDWESGDWNIAHNPTAWNMMFDAVQSDSIGLEWEPCHQMVSLIDPIEQLRDWVSKIFHVHGKDATIKWDVVRKFGVHGPNVFAQHRTPGFGDTNWTDVISILREGGFKGSIDIEGWHDPVYKDDLEMTGQVHALNYLKQCRGGYYIPNPT